MQYRLTPGSSRIQQQFRIAQYLLFILCIWLINPEAFLLFADNHPTAATIEWLSKLLLTLVLLTMMIFKKTSPTEKAVFLVNDKGDFTILPSGQMYAIEKGSLITQLFCWLSLREKITNDKTRKVIFSDSIPSRDFRRLCRIVTSRCKYD